MSTNRKSYLAAVIALIMALSVSHVCRGQAKKIISDTVEITDTDITSIRSFNGNHATVFGIALGMGRNTVKNMVSRYPFIKMTEDPFNERRFYLKDASQADTNKITLAYLKWLNYDSGLYQIILYPPMSKYMKGLSSTIVSPDCVDPSSDIYRSFLGEPSARQVSMNMPKINAKTTLLYYPKQNIVIEESKTASGTQYSLVLTHKW
jgi:hypothetical protein